MNFRTHASRALRAVSGICAVTATTAHASPRIDLDSAVYVEKQQAGNVRTLEPASQLSRGDRVVTILTWRNAGGDGGFTLTNPLPRSIAYQSSARDDEEVSVDGGRNWGRLGELQIAGRLAAAEDVTHVRWRVPARNAAEGQIAYSGIVR